MCSARQIIDPSGVLYRQKWADPMGVTKTVIGDPTGQVRRARSEDQELRQGATWTMGANGQMTKKINGTGTKTVLGS